MKVYAFRQPMLSSEELKRRISAARILRGITQADFQARLADDGFGKTELGRIERGQLPLTKVRRQVIARAVGVPEAWFLEPDVDVIVGATPEGLEDDAPAGPPGELGRDMSDGPPIEQSPGRTVNLRAVGSEPSTAG